MQGLTIGKGSARNQLYFFTFEFINVCSVMLTPTV